nr:hypothetical protein [Tanacetum cinerariifolium]
LWNTLTQDAKTREYNFQPDEQCFTLNVNLLRKALEITPIDSAHPFVSPPAGEQDDTSVNVVRDTLSLVDTKTGDDTKKFVHGADTKILNICEEQGEDVSDMMELEERSVELDIGQAGSDPDVAFTFGDQFLNDKLTEEEPRKGNVDTKVESMKREEFLDATAKSQKRCRDDQDPPSPHPKDFDQSKKKKHDSDALALK